MKINLNFSVQFTDNLNLFSIEDFNELTRSNQTIDISYNLETLSFKFDIGENSSIFCNAHQMFHIIHMAKKYSYVFKLLSELTSGYSYNNGIIDVAKWTDKEIDSILIVLEDRCGCKFTVGNKLIAVDSYTIVKNYLDKYMPGKPLASHLKACDISYKDLVYYLDLAYSQDDLELLKLSDGIL